MSAQYTPGQPVPAFPRGIHIDGYWSEDEWRVILSLAARHRNSRARVAKYKADGSDTTYARESANDAAEALRTRAGWARGAIFNEEWKSRRTHVFAKATGGAS